MLKRILVKGRLAFLKTWSAIWSRRQTVSAAILILAAIATLVQLYINQRALETNQRMLENQIAQNQNRPEIVYTTYQSVIPSNASSDAADKLVDEFYKRTSNYMNSNPRASYKDALSFVLPLTSTIPLRPTKTIINISNRGRATATKIRVSVEMGRSISDFDMAKEALSPLKGGKGQTNLDVVIDRIVAGDKRTLTILSADEFQSGLSDQIILGLPGQVESLPLYAFYPGLKSTKVSYSTSSSLLPVLYYRLEKLPKPGVEVTSLEEGFATEQGFAFVTSAGTNEDPFGGIPLPTKP